MQVIAHDYETTGRDPVTCGVAASAIVIANIFGDGSYEVVAEEVAKHHPGVPIPAEASGIHGIYDADVAGLPDYEESLPATYEQAMKEFSPEAVLGYNSNSYDNVIGRRVGLPATGLIEIDLMTAASRLMSRGYLERARLVDAYATLVGGDTANAHDAMADITMTLDLIKPVMQIMEFGTFSDFVEWVTKPEINPDMAMPFGKHRGLPLNTVPSSYLNWLQGKGNLDPDLAATIRAVLSGGS